ncbi:IS30 family transposase [Rhizobium ruizarguesonis]|uniref:IS30 family transposase n=1 Tax=Rhizobium ruizarguesonis TaxID=2081791 RepID=UPI001CFB7D3F|nr:IS30 family transposase [Rhizobium ruizarguesonis]UED29287.1 IS30 family transposase [Rhizobium ruizarguesonis]
MSIHQKDNGSNSRGFSRNGGESAGRDMLASRRIQSFQMSVRSNIGRKPSTIARNWSLGSRSHDLERVQGNANVATVVERTSRFTMLFKNNDRSQADHGAAHRRAQPLPRHARQSLTFDRGFEFVSWRRLKQGMGTDAWFCDPSAPWQKGSVENMNRRIRRYLPRDTAVLSVPDESIRSLIDRLNSTPRKCLGFRTPAEVFRVK